MQRINKQRSVEVKNILVIIVTCCSFSVSQAHASADPTRCQSVDFPSRATKEDINTVYQMARQAYSYEESQLQSEIDHIDFIAFKNDRPLNKQEHNARNRLREEQTNCRIKFIEMIGLYQTALTTSFDVP